MARSPVTIDVLKRILRESAGDATTTTLGGDILDVRFEDLGYDSLALLETAGRIEREYGIRLVDETVDIALTPRELLTAVNNS
jgi:minimal PKS acyl carrier protein